MKKVLFVILFVCLNASEFSPPRESTLLNRADKTIYLGIKTNILCVDDRLEARYLSSQMTEFYGGGRDIELNDFTATLYLGKIIFEKNKQGILAPKFIPTTITDSSFEGLNTFWLNEINKKATKPFQSMFQPYDSSTGGGSRPSADSIPYQKIHYFRHKDNIVLTKDQIISYFAQLHKENTEFIANYIDSINANHGIKAYNLNDRIYDELLKNGIVNKSMIKRYADTHKVVRNNALDLMALDYLSTLKASNHKLFFKIVLYDELFYPYFVWSLRNFLVPYFAGRFQDENNLLFNAGAYKKYAGQHRIANPYKDEFKNIFNEMEIFYANILPNRYREGYIEGYELYFYYYGINFSPTDEEYLYLKLPISKGYKQISPNKKISELPKHELEALEWLPKEKQKYTISIPSPLGKYYFELSDNKDIYIEFFYRIYPNITNPPKGWSKEMMRKLELGLE